MQGFTQLAAAVGSFMQSLLQDLGAALAEVVRSVRGLVQNPVDQLLQFAQGALSRITQFAGQFVRNLLSGNIVIPSLADLIGAFSPTPSRGPITKPRPPGGPITSPVLERLLVILLVVGALVLSAIPALAVVVEFLIAIGLSPVAALIVLGVLVILAAILLLLLLYALYRWLTRPKPSPPEKITSLTVATQPGVQTRTTIGVGEQVWLTHSPGGATWATTAGTVFPATGTIVLFTAPDTAQTVTVTGGAATIVFTVLAPASVHMDRLPGTGVKHSVNRPDSGIATLPFLLPDNVNFLRVTYRELNTGATASGVYSCHGGGGVGHCKQPAGGACDDLFMTDTVASGKGTQAVRGDCVYSGDCPLTAPSPPFTPGSISFSIPYEYKIGAGAYHHFATVLQVSALKSDASTLTSDKAGAHGDTTVAAGTVTIPGCP